MGAIAGLARSGLPACGTGPDPGRWPVTVIEAMLEPRLSHLIPVLLLVAAVAGVPTSGFAEDRTGSPPPTETAPRPAADTTEPGRTATDAVTNPATVPPTEGQVGTGKPPGAPGAPPPSR